jgi:hypothetical protein
VWLPLPHHRGQPVWLPLSGSQGHQMSRTQGNSINLFSLEAPDAINVSIFNSINVSIFNSTMCCVPPTRSMELFNAPLSEQLFASECQLKADLNRNKTLLCRVSPFSIATRSPHCAIRIVQVYRSSIDCLLITFLFDFCSLSICSLLNHKGCSARLLHGAASLPNR